MKLSLKTNKDLGQNFLINESVQNKIIKNCGIEPTDIILEIGAGRGAITRLIAQHAKKVFAVEVDKQLCKNFLVPEFSGTNVEIINSDILKFDFKTLRAGHKIKIIGNIPYNISTPIIEKVINNKDLFEKFFMTVQLEFGHRMTANPGSKTYGAFSCFVQYHSDTKLLFKIKASAFQPMPNVESCFIKMSFPEKPKYRPTDKKLLFNIIKAAFGQRRKTIENSISSIADKKTLKILLNNIGIDPRSRAENLSIEDFIKISNLLNFS